MKFRLLPLSLLAVLFLFVACSDDDDSTPVTPTDSITLSNIVPSSGPIGTTVRITGKNFGTDPAQLVITFGGIAVTPTSLTDTEIRIVVPSTLPIGATSIRIKKGSGQTKELQFTVEDPIVGVWVSEGETKVAPLLYGPPFNIRKIVATFKSDGSYIVVQTDSSQTSLTLTGIYVAAAGNAPAPNDNIRTITVNQGTPTSVTAEGIYEVTVNTDGSISMKYEIAQTEPPLSGVTKPTPVGGFGSTSGGLLGTINVQNYVKSN